MEKCIEPAAVPQRSVAAFASPSATPRILIVSPVRLLRDGLATLLQQRTRVHEVSAVDSAQAALAACPSFRPGLILLDAGSDEALEAARALSPCGVRIVGFASRELEHDVLAYAEAGIACFVPREASVEELLAAIDRAAHGELLCSPRAAGIMFRRLAAMARGELPAPPSQGLTDRERQILDLLDTGRSNKEIARILGIGLPTVKNHVHNVLAKLHVRRRGEAVARMRKDREPPA